MTFIAMVLFTLLVFGVITTKLTLSILLGAVFVLGVVRSAAS